MRTTKGQKAQPTVVIATIAITVMITMTVTAIATMWLLATVS